MLIDITDIRNLKMIMTSDHKVYLKKILLRKKVSTTMFFEIIYLKNFEKPKCSAIGKWFVNMTHLF